MITLFFASLGLLKKPVFELHAKANADCFKCPNQDISLEKLPSKYIDEVWCMILRQLVKNLINPPRVGAAIVPLAKCKTHVSKDFDDEATNSVVCPAKEKTKRLKNVLAKRAPANDADMPTISIELETTEPKVSKADKVFGELEKYGLKCNEKTLSVALKCRWSKLGRVSEIESFLERMVDDGPKANCVTYSYLIEGFERANKVDDAVKIFNYLGRMRAPLSGEITPSTGSVTKFIERLCSYAAPHAALMIYNKAKKARFGKCRMLLNMWDEMQGSGYTSDMKVYEYIINGLCNTGQLESAALYSHGRSY
ncbi:hypothetical protein BUALT_BualtUnG0014800 [Buddleja alternifolia]|uniref:Pentatricopeptide repeat-containing protein n=1 Tax=Buddleja alternifolia TaxID=168488 RepID=A0AAV6W7L1_9LAMI|nr:hypothetical protein BUALT_BualtUnG0014800 [Buddleja alternifolia]